LHFTVTSRIISPDNREVNAIIRMRVELRPYRPGDDGGICRLVKKVLGEYGLAMDPGETDRDLSDIPAHYTRRGGAFKVLVHGDRIIGSYGLYPVSDFCCELRKMYLYRQYRGMGMGRRMLKNALKTARELEFAEMVLESNSCLKEALQLYTGHGFVRYHPRHLSRRCDLALRKILVSPSPEA